MVKVRCTGLVSVGLYHLLERGNPLDDLGISEYSLLGLGDLELSLVVGFTLQLSLGLESLNNVLVLPSNLPENKISILIKLFPQSSKVEDSGVEMRGT